MSALQHILVLPFSFMHSCLERPMFLKPTLGSRPILSISTGPLSVLLSLSQQCQGMALPMTIKIYIC